MPLLHAYFIGEAEGAAADVVSVILDPQASCALPASAPMPASMKGSAEAARAAVEKRVCTTVALLLLVVAQSMKVAPPVAPFPTAESSCHRASLMLKHGLVEAVLFNGGMTVRVRLNVTRGRAAVGVSAGAGESVEGLGDEVGLGEREGEVRGEALGEGMGEGVALGTEVVVVEGVGSSSAPVPVSGLAMPPLCCSVRRMALRK